MLKYIGSGVLCISFFVFDCRAAYNQTYEKDVLDLGNPSADVLNIAKSLDKAHVLLDSSQFVSVYLRELLINLDGRNAINRDKDMVSLKPVSNFIYDFENQETINMMRSIVSREVENFVPESIWTGIAFSNTKFADSSLEMLDNEAKKNSSYVGIGFKKYNYTLFLIYHDSRVTNNFYSIDAEGAGIGVNYSWSNVNLYSIYNITVNNTQKRNYAGDVALSAPRMQNVATGVELFHETNPSKRKKLHFNKKELQIKRLFSSSDNRSKINHINKLSYAFSYIDGSSYEEVGKGLLYSVNRHTSMMHDVSYNYTLSNDYQLSMYSSIIPMFFLAIGYSHYMLGDTVGSFTDMPNWHDINFSEIDNNGVYVHSETRVHYKFNYFSYLSVALGAKIRPKYTDFNVSFSYKFDL